MTLFTDSHKWEETYTNLYALERLCLPLSDYFGIL